MFDVIEEYVIPAKAGIHLHSQKKVAQTSPSVNQIKKYSEKSLKSAQSVVQTLTSCFPQCSTLKIFENNPI